MPNLRISSLGGRPLLDLASYSRRGPGHRDRLSPEEIAHIGRTVRRSPEVMVKVLSKDSDNLRSVARHLNYIGRGGGLELETDDGERLQGRDAGQRLVEDWDLDLDRDRRDSKLTGTIGRAPKLVHKIMLSMPPGTPAKGVLEAARNFAREEFALKHRYALALHTDEPHPHVHLVVKAVSEQGVRLNIRKETLRQWRSGFARHLQALGVPANATQRYVRGESSPRKPDGIYRASLRAESTHMRARTEAVARELASGGLKVEPAKTAMLRTRSEVREAWQMLSDILVRQQQPDLAHQVRQFADRMPPPMTEKEMIAARLLERARPKATRDPRSRS
jgi:hypothetical protein